MSLVDLGIDIDVREIRRLRTVQYCITQIDDMSSRELVQLISQLDLSTLAKIAFYGGIRALWNFYQDELDVIEAMIWNIIHRRPIKWERRFG